MRRDGFFRPILGTPQDKTMEEVHRPGQTIYHIPVYRNRIRRGTLIVKLFSFTNGDLTVTSKYEKEPWEKSEPFVSYI